MIGIMLNVNAKTVQLFVNGSASNHIMNMPDNLFEGDKLKEPLYPAVASKGTAVECNFSKKTWKELPFKVRTIGSARKSDVVMFSSERETGILH